MSNISISGTLSIERVDTAHGQAVRTAFLADHEPYTSFACWVSVEALSGNIKRRITSDSLAAQESTMIGYTSFSDKVAQLLMGQEEEQLNTFGIGEQRG